MACNTLRPLQYTKLSPHKAEIRVLDLHPNARPEEVIQCSLVTVSLQDNPRFEALSYAWGDPTVVEAIAVDHQRIQVPASAWGALNALRYADRTRRLWIDAICINQQDMDERTSQVKLMGTVYRTAESVRVWLGPGDDAAVAKDDAINDSKNENNEDARIGDAATESEDDDSADKDDVPAAQDAITILRGMTSTQGAKTVFALRKQSRNGIKMLERFFSRPWWERLWVVQEVALGRHVIFQQGVKEITYDELLAAYTVSEKFLREDLYGFHYSTFSSSAGDFLEVFASVRVLEETRQLFAKQNSAEEEEEEESWDRYATMTWATIVNLLQNRKASVEQDRLYSLYGLLPPSLMQKPGMEPSYTVSTEETFTEVTYSLIQSTSSLMIFNFLDRARAREKKDSSPDPNLLPSWVPDWRLPPHNKYESTRGVARQRLFNASASPPGTRTPLHARRLSDGRTLLLRAYFLDMVHYYATTAVFPNSVPALEGTYSAWRDLWAQSAAGKPSFATYAKGEPRESAFQRTMVLDCEPTTADDGGGGLRRLTAAERVAMWEAHKRANEIGLASWGDPAVAENEGGLAEADARRVDYLISCAKGRAFFATSLQLIGMGGSNMAAGDHVFVVEGNSHPVLLRPSKRYANTWRAVSECYVHGFMDGEGDDCREGLAGIQRELHEQPAVREMLGTERNPRWDEVNEECEDGWQWILVE
ncbi:HET-domain-containing protein [Parathielavia hyrcaniae]|uniref:HET-domain-containing protein n=1 Tax=Parathielavia hyrcaniae TaxID=113614 RepID=A0AAN6Q5K9_9PEZI|nr:HET-domain-containing protein [Parathielavia hyrcaniae]